MPTVDEEIAILQQQQALFTQFGKAFLEGKLDGAGSAKAYLLALDPTLEITPAAFLIG
jgi:hypothetical protein